MILNKVMEGSLTELFFCSRLFHIYLISSSHSLSVSDAFCFDQYSNSVLSFNLVFVEEFVVTKIDAGYGGIKQ